MLKYIFLSGFLFLLLADQRIVTWLPVYVLDGVTLVFLGSFFLRHRKELAHLVSSRTFLLLVIFLLAALLSLLWNPFSLTTLGQYKSWLLLPALGAYLYWSLASKEAQEESVRFWYAGVILILLSLAPFLLSQNLTYDGRLAGLYASPNFLGFFLFPGLLLAYRYYIASDTLYDRFLHGGIGACTLFALYFTYSYAAWLAAALCVGIFLFFGNQQKNKKWLLGLGALVVIFGGLLVFEHTQSGKLQALLAFEERSSLASRVMIWESAIFSLRQEPLFGIGLGNFQREYLANQAHFPPYLEWAVPQPHNLLLAVWLETGALGLVAFLGLVGGALVRGWKEKQDQVIRLQLALFIGMLAYGLVDTPLFGNALAFVFWTNLFALVFARSRD